MKKALYFLLALITTSTAHAQIQRRAVPNACADRPARNTNNNMKPGPQAKGTAATIFSEHFDTGLPAGWTTGVFAGPNATWKWYPQGQVSTAPNSLSAIASSGGFMIYDADSIGNQNATLIPQGWLKSPVISCVGYSTVAVKFAEYFVKQGDSCYVDVSTNNFATFTRFPVSANNNMYNYDAIPYNPYQAMVNISSAAANLANVQVRLSYYGQPGGSYSWQVDDFMLTELDATNVSMHNSFLLSTGVGAYNTTMSTVPKTFVDSISPITKLDNLGYNGQAGFTVGVKIFMNNTQVYNQSQTIASLPVNAVDSLVSFPAYTPPAQTGNSFIVAYNLSLPGNLNVYNVVDTVRFSIADSQWKQNPYLLEGRYYIHRPASLGEMSTYAGTRFDAGAGSTDTLTAVFASFGPGTTVGTQVVAQIYKLDNPPTNGWIPMYTTYPLTLAASDISGPASINYAKLEIDPSNGPAVINEGTWAAVLTPVNAPANSTVIVQYSDPCGATGFAGYFGQEDSSNNDGSFTFGFQTQATGVAAIPFVYLSLGTYVPAAGTSVWPGDVNYDHIVNNNDALDIALAYGNIGTARPGATNIYTAQPCTNWGYNIVPAVDMKNADCNGDGTVGYSDTIAIAANYGLTHPKGVHTPQPKASGLPDLYLDNTAIAFTAGTTVHIPVKLGSAAQPMNNILGLAAQVKISGMTLFNAPTITYSTSWLGNVANLLNFTKGVNSNQTDWAFARIDHSNVSGNGTIATLNVDIPFNANGQAIFYFDNVKMIDNAGNVITGYNVLDDTVSIIPSSVKTTAGPVHELAIVPNPSASQSAVQLYLDAPSTIHITVSDLLGRIVYEFTRDGKQGLQSFDLPSSTLVSGIYTVRLNSDTWQAAQTLKWIKN